MEAAVAVAGMTIDQRRVRLTARLKTIRLRMMIGRELDKTTIEGLFGGPLARTWRTFWNQRGRP